MQSLYLDKTSIEYNSIFQWISDVSMKEYVYQEIRYARKWFDWSVYYIHPKRNKSIYDKVLMGCSFVVGCVIKNLVVVWSNVSKIVCIHTGWPIISSNNSIYVSMFHFKYIWYFWIKCFWILEIFRYNQITST